MIALRTAAGLILALSLSSGCGPPGVRPVSFPDPEVSCPGGRESWSLQIRDERVSREDGARATAAVREAIQKSFPGCRWAAAEASDGASIEITIHRLATVFIDGAWEAAAEWSVQARDSAGRTLTEFEADEEDSRLDYRAADSEKESLSEAFRKAVSRTVKGLAAMPRPVALRPREGTAETLAASGRSAPPGGLIL